MNKPWLTPEIKDAVKKNNNVSGQQKTFLLLYSIEISLNYSHLKINALEGPPLMSKIVWHQTE